MAEIRNARFVGAFVDYGGTVANVRHPEFGAAGDGATDDTGAIQSAIASAAGEVPVFVPEGTYWLESPLLVPSRTHLILAPGAVMKRGSSNLVMLRNSVNDVGGYGANHDITIEGGEWDGNGTEFDDDCGIFAFAHVDGITIRNTYLHNIERWHNIEFNSCRRIRVHNSIFADSDPVANPNRELIQLDQATAVGSRFPYFSIVEDHTPCEDVLIQGCVFRGAARGFGSHSRAGVSAESPGDPHRNVRIIGNLFEDLAESGIALIGYEDVVIHGNNFRNTGIGVEVKSQFTFGNDGGVRRGFVISDNTFRGLTDTDTSRAIWVQGRATNPDLVRGGIIARNRIYGIARHGITIDHTRDWIVEGNSIENIGGVAPTGVGVFVFNSQECSVRANHIVECVRNGIRVAGTDRASVRNEIAGNLVLRAGQTGIIITESASHNRVEGGRVEACNQEDDGYNGITIGADCDENVVQGVVVRSGGTQENGIQITVSSANDNWVTNNDLRGAGEVADFDDGGTGTVTTAGNLT